MTMTTIDIQVPQEMVPMLASDDQQSLFERNAMILYPQIHSMKISHGRAAEMLGVSKLDLITFYGSLGIPYLDTDPVEVEQELAAFRKVRKPDLPGA